MNVFIQLRLTGRPEMERTPWLVNPDLELQSVKVLAGNGYVQCIPTGHYEGDHQVWVPEDRLDDYKETKAE